MSETLHVERAGGGGSGGGAQCATDPPRRIAPPAPPIAPRDSGPDDQATRLRALMEAVDRGHPPRAPRPEPIPEARPEPRQNPAHIIRHRTDLGPRRARLIAFASGKGGVGKTNTCVNIAIALADMGKHATVVDADLGLANADVLCGLSPTKRLQHVVQGAETSNGHLPSGAMRQAGAASMREIAIDAPGGFRLVPGAAGVARMAELTHEQRVRLLGGLAELERDCDLVLVDTAAGLSRDVITFMQVADLGVVVASPEPTSITDAYALIKCTLTERQIAQRAHHLRAENGAHGVRPRLALLVNQVADEREAAAVHTRIAAACSRFLGYQLPLLGWIAQDAKVVAAVRKRRPFLLDSPRCRAADDTRRVAKALARAVEPEGSASGKTRRGLTRLLARIVLRGR